jgi:energy-coupling factor transporter ATP-binding protein EcfA2
MKPTITVEIRGPQGCGKTQLFTHLFNLLRANPFEPRGIETPLIELRTVSGDRVVIEPPPEPKPYGYAVKASTGYIANQGDQWWHEIEPVGWALFGTREAAERIAHTYRGEVVPVFKR